MRVSHTSIMAEDIEEKKARGKKSQLVVYVNRTHHLPRRSDPLYSCHSARSTRRHGD